MPAGHGRSIAPCVIWRTNLPRSYGHGETFEPIPRKLREQIHQNPEPTMSSPELPKIRVIAVPIARVVLLGQIGHQLRSYYQDLMEAPIPDRLEQLARRFPES